MGLLACINQALSVLILIQCGCASPQETPNDMIQSNNYIVQHCSLLAPQVQKVLESLYEVLAPAIWETHYGVTSAPYQAFFKNSYYETLVEEVLRSISFGAALHLESDNKIHVPSLVCALKPDTVIAREAGQEVDIYDVCKDHPTWAVMYYPGTSNIFICPLFFLLPTLPAAGNCPTVNETTNQFEGNFVAFWQSQMYMLLHEIAHLYTGATVENSVDEVMDWNYAFSLSPINTTLNALNYVLFVASVDKECEQYPQPAPSQTSGGRRKLETMVDLVNTSSADITQIQKPGGVPNEVAPFHTDVQNVTLAPQNLTLLR